MDCTIEERRTDARFAHPGVTSARATLRPGCIATLVNLSAGGALVQSPRPLRPGARIHVQLTTDKRACAITALVLRCAVSMIDDHGVIYRGALRFDRPCDLFWEIRTRTGYSMPGDRWREHAASGQSIPATWPLARRR